MRHTQSHHHHPPHPSVSSRKRGRRHLLNRQEFSLVAFVPQLADTASTVQCSCSSSHDTSVCHRQQLSKQHVSSSNTRVSSSDDHHNPTPPTISPHPISSQHPLAPGTWLLGCPVPQLRDLPSALNPLTHSKHISKEWLFSQTASPRTSSS